ncbi:MAG: C4-type zinc ribbon domain-containing protein [Myxococcota bacterium]|nr:C4-type zinc ribbon domain-containing protein [Myxococcota bacterium]
MQKELINLFEIQKIDSEMFQLQERRKTLAEKLETLESQVNGLGGEIASLESEMGVFEKEAKTLESTVQAEKLKIKKWEARLKEIRNQREFLALSREIDGAKKSVERAEERTLEIWKSKEAVEQKLEDIRDKQTDLGVQANDERDNVKSSIADFEEQSTQSAARREELSGGVPASIMRLYDQVRAKRRGVGLAEVVGGTCMGCNVALRPQQFIVLQRGESIEQCPHCQKLMIWSEHVKQLSEDTPAAEAAGDESAEATAG